MVAARASCPTCISQPETPTRYPGGIALRFARVIRYRDDLTPDDIGSLEVIGSLLA